MRIRRDTDHIMEQDVELMAKVSDALAHPLRVKIFRYILSENLKGNNVCNKNIVEHFGYAQATISQHLSLMAKSGLVQIEKVNRFSNYYINTGMLMAYVDMVKTFE